MSEDKKEENVADVRAPFEPTLNPAADPKMILQELEKSAAADNSSAAPDVSNDVAQDTPLITDAMRWLDELLARFRK